MCMYTDKIKRGRTMIRKFLKTVLCATLSLTMLTGGVLVSAAPVQVQKAQLEKPLQTGKIILKDKSSVKRGQRAIQNDSNAVRNANLFYNAASFNKVYVDRNDRSYTNWIVGAENSENPLITRISMPKSGKLYLDCINQDSNGDAKEATVRLYKGWDTSGTALNSMNTTSGVLTAENLARGVYTVVVTVPDESIGYTAIYPHCITSEDIGVKSGIQMVIGTGRTMYQSFSIKKRSQVWMDSNLAKNGYIEQKTGNRWIRVSDTNYFYSNSNNAERSYYALSTGTYRFVMQPSKGDIVQYCYGSKAYTAKYATKKSKAKLIKRKKSVTNVLTASDKNKATHYYKIKVAKKGSLRIDASVYQTAGKMNFCVYGKGIKAKTLSMKDVKKGYWTGKVRKGTYYIKVTKCTKTTSGRYTIKYTK